MSDIHALVLDVSEYWLDEMLEHTGRVFDILVYDNDLTVHPCSIAPHIETHFVETRIEEPWDELPAEIDHSLIEAECLRAYEIRYISRYDLKGAERLTNLHPLPDGKLGQVSLGSFDHAEDPIEAAIESVRENGL